MVAASFLFVPAHEPRKIERALSSETDAVIFDLEDAVPDAQKQAARDAVAALKSGVAPERWVRVNSDARFFGADLRELNWDALAGAFLPKAGDPHSVVRLQEAGARRIVLIIESAAGLEALPALASASSRVERCAMGTLDFSLDLGLLAVDDVDDSELIWHARADLVLKSRACGLHPPIDGVFVHLDDEQRLRQICERGHRLGYSGKLLIHPRQIPVANAVFTPSQEDISFAREIVDAYAEAERQGRGAIQVRGKMVDRPVVERARIRLKQAGEE